MKQNFTLKKIIVNLFPLLKVCIILTGNKHSSQTVYLYDKKRKVFRRSGVDTFIISSDQLALNF